MTCSCICKLTQSVPSSPRVGRRIRVLVTDAGQRHESLIGAIELASPIYTLASRDRFLDAPGTAGSTG